MLPRSVTLQRWPPACSLWGPGWRCSAGDGGSLTDLRCRRRDGRLGAVLAGGPHRLVPIAVRDRVHGAGYAVICTTEQLSVLKNVLCQHRRGAVDRLIDEDISVG